MIRMGINTKKPFCYWCCGSIQEGVEVCPCEDSENIKQNSWGFFEDAERKEEGGQNVATTSITTT